MRDRLFSGSLLVVLATLAWLSSGRFGPTGWLAVAGLTALGVDSLLTARRGVGE